MKRLNNDKPPFEKAWSDQPDEVLNARPLLHCSGRKYTVEVRRVVPPGDGYLITIGSILGSQTLKTDRADTAFGVVDTAVNYTGTGQTKTPRGCIEIHPKKRHAC